MSKNDIEKKFKTVASSLGFVFQKEVGRYGEYSITFIGPESSKLTLEITRIDSPAYQILITPKHSSSEYSLFYLRKSVPHLFPQDPQENNSFESHMQFLMKYLDWILSHEDSYKNAYLKEVKLN